MSEKNPTPEEKLFIEHDADQQPPPDLVAYNELRSCADLFRMHKTGVLDIHPEFQRDVVWSSPAQTRLIDSLIKQLPIPSMCFSLDHRTQQWQVIDGLQRMSAIVKFLDDRDWRLSRLEDIDPRIAGKLNSDFRVQEALQVLLRRVENLTLPITVIRCDHTNQAHTEYLFTIFHRLNTGGTRLTNQEIRNCIYAGRFNSLLKTMDGDQHWRKVKKHISGSTERFRSIELILRFLAFFHAENSYTGSLSKFLNRYMAINRDASDDVLASMQLLFCRTVRSISDKVLGASPPKQGFSVWEAVLVGVAHNLDRIEQAGPQTVEGAYTTLVNSPALSGVALQADLSSTDKVRARLAAAKHLLNV